MAGAANSQVEFFLSHPWVGRCYRAGCTGCELYIGTFAVDMKMSINWVVDLVHSFEPNDTLSVVCEERKTKNMTFFNVDTLLYLRFNFLKKMDVLGITP